MSSLDLAFNNSLISSDPSIINKFKEEDLYNVNQPTYINDNVVEKEPTRNPEEKINVINEDDNKYNMMCCGNLYNYIDYITNFFSKF